MSMRQGPCLASVTRPYRVWDGHQNQSRGLTGSENSEPMHQVHSLHRLFDLVDDVLKKTFALLGASGQGFMPLDLKQAPIEFTLFVSQARGHDDAHPHQHISGLRLPPHPLARYPQPGVVLHTGRDIEDNRPPVDRLDLDPGAQGRLGRG